MLQCACWQACCKPVAVCLLPVVMSTAHLGSWLGTAHHLKKRFNTCVCTCLPECVSAHTGRDVRLLHQLAQLEGAFQYPSLLTIQQQHWQLRGETVVRDGLDDRDDHAQNDGPAAASSPAFVGGPAPGAEVGLAHATCMCSYAHACIMYACVRHTSGDLLYFRGCACARICAHACARFCTRASKSVHAHPGKIGDGNARVHSMQASKLGFGMARALYTYDKCVSRIKHLHVHSKQHQHSMPSR